jgi:hypothetical protein
MSPTALLRLDAECVAGMVAMHDDWHLDRVVSAIGSTAQGPGNPAVADALAGAIGRQQGRERVVARQREQDEKEATGRQEEEAVTGDN